ncbi:MAG: hypothetical protein HPY85_13715 [Anaerolineae bacterium]|nr:hypothetical protein [Anaerolineae bacterium]
MEQIIKQLDWLDSERRRDKDAIAALQEQLQAYQREVPKLTQRQNEMETEISLLKAQLDRFDQLELQIKNLQVEMTRNTQDVEKKLVREIELVEKHAAAEVAKVNIAIGDLKKSLAVLPEIQATLTKQDEEDHRLGRMIASIEKSVEAVGREDETRQRTIKMLEENRRQDAKRILDLQAEGEQLRKRQDEQRGKLELLAESVRKYDGRLGDLRNGETQRQQEVTAFIEKQTLRLVDQEHEWKEIREKFELFASKFSIYEQRIAELSVMSQSLEKSAESFDDVNERLERRIHEVTELQRLSSEHMHQDWEEFQGSEQKRWAAYILKDEERRRDLERVLDQINTRTEQVEHATQEVSDLIVAIKESRLYQLQALIDVLKQDLEVD